MMMPILLAGCLGGAATQEAVREDWSETARQWGYQSYWQDPNRLQKYTFTPNTADKIAGRHSMEVHMEVAPDTRRFVELRLTMDPPLDLSQVEAVEVHYKVLQGKGLRAKGAYFCDPTFQKLAMLHLSPDVELVEGADWKRLVFDLAEASTLDKAKPAGPAAYDRHDVTHICLNFDLPDGAVDIRLLVDGLGPVKLPAPAVRVEKQADGSFVAQTDRYRVVIGANGYLQSVRAGQTEFLEPYRAFGASSCFDGNQPQRGAVALGAPQALGRTRLKAQGEKAAIQYAFREQEFEVTFQQTFTPAGGILYLALARDVIGALDGGTDRGLFAEGLQTGPQIHTRLVTASGGVLTVFQHVEGYSRLSLEVLPEKRWALGLLAWSSAPHVFRFCPVGQPTAADAFGFAIDCASPDFLLPGGQPVHFDITATNYAAVPLQGRVTFQVCDYLTREPVGQKTTALNLGPKQTAAVPTDVPVAQPGPYRGRLVVADDQDRVRRVEWVFTYDFPHYQPELTRPPDFQAFWKQTLEELARVPLDAQMTAVPEVSTPAEEAFKVSLATLAGRRVHCWYWKPRKPGKYPAKFHVPSSGVYPAAAHYAPHSPDNCALWMAIHGLPVDVDLQKPVNDPAATNYWTHGIESPQTSMWRVIYASLVRGVDFLASREEVDPKRIMVLGGSQGGGLSLVLAGLDRRISLAVPMHSGLARLDWTVLHKPGFWPFGLSAKPANQTVEQFLKTLSYFDAANFTPDIACPVVAEVSLLDTVTASGNQICALAHVKPGLLELVCDPWTSHASMPRGARLVSEAQARWMRGEPPVKNPVKPVP